MKLKPHQVGQAGEHFVAAELHRRGAYAVAFSGNMPDIDVLASDVDHSEQVAIQVKTKTAGTWHASINRGRQRTEDSADNRYWVLVDIGRDAGRAPGYFIVPEWWIENHIHETHLAYLAEHQGRRPRNPNSTHFAIRPDDVERWRDRWDLLPILQGASECFLHSADGVDYELGSADDVARAIEWLSHLARGGSGGGGFSRLLGDFVRAYRAGEPFAPDYIAGLRREADDLLAAERSRIPPAVRRILRRIAEMQPA